MFNGRNLIDLQLPNNIQGFRGFNIRPHRKNPPKNCWSLKMRERAHLAGPNGILEDF